MKKKPSKQKPKKQVDVSDLRIDLKAWKADQEAIYQASLQRDSWSFQFGWR